MKSNDKNDKNYHNIYQNRNDNDNNTNDNDNEIDNDNEDEDSGSDDDNQRVNQQKILIIATKRISTQCKASVAPTIRFKQSWI